MNFYLILLDTLIWRNRLLVHTSTRNIYRDKIHFTLCRGYSRRAERRIFVYKLHR